MPQRFANGQDEEEVGFWKGRYIELDSAVLVSSHCSLTDICTHAAVASTYAFYCVPCASTL
jgi:hypothetical protein